MARILFAWELGASLGHIDRMLLQARALRERGHEVRLLVRDLSRAHRRIVSQGFAVGQSPIWLPRLAQGPRMANFAGVLAGAGWLDPAGLAGLLAGWRDAYALSRADVVIVDHAPTALLALRGTGIVAMASGNSFEVPPIGGAFPPLNPDDPKLPPLAPAWDRTVLGPANEALRLAGGPPMARLTDLFRDATRVILSLPELAHFDGYADGEVLWTGPSFVDDVGAEPEWPAGDGPAVFAYMNPSHAQFEAMAVALRDAGCVALVVAQGVAPDVVARLQTPRLRIVAQPLRMDRVLQRADAVVTYGSLGTVTAATLHGRPMLAMPMHPEQALVSRRVALAGIGLRVDGKADAAQIGRDLHRILHDEGMRQRVRALAARHAGITPAMAGAAVADRIDALLAERAAGSASASASAPAGQGPSR
jgi:hypothetical protein